MSKFKINPDGRDALERSCRDLFGDFEIVTLTVMRTEQEGPYTRMNSVLAEVIQQRIQTKAVPISIRKRLLYEQSLAS